MGIEGQEDVGGGRLKVNALFTAGGSVLLREVRRHKLGRSPSSHGVRWRGVRLDLEWRASESRTGLVKDAVERSMAKAESLVGWSRRRCWALV
jgi:hypothetical protein